MVQLNFADRYAEAGLSPTAEVIANRKDSVGRIVTEINVAQLLDLVGAYYSSPSLDLSWFRDQFAKEDASFSLVNNERECRVLSAIILSQLVAGGEPRSILAVIAGNVAGRRTPKDARWLVTDAFAALGNLAVTERRPAQIDIKVTSTVQQKLPDEISGIGQNDWPKLIEGILKIRNEAQSSMRTMATQTTKALQALNRQVRLQREESQMLWWIFSGHSRSLEHGFASLAPAQAALVAAIDLAMLTTVSDVGPVAAPAMLERVIALAKRSKGHAPRRLDEAIDGLTRESLQKLQIKPNAVPARIAPLMTAIELAGMIGLGSWHTRFDETTGIKASTEFQPLELAEQLYREHLLGQLL